MVQLRGQDRDPRPALLPISTSSAPAHFGTRHRIQVNCRSRTGHVARPLCATLAVSAAGPSGPARYRAARPAMLMCRRSAYAWLFRRQVGWIQCEDASAVEPIVGVFMDGAWAVSLGHMAAAIDKTSLPAVVDRDVDRVGHHGARARRLGCTFLGSRASSMSSAGESLRRSAV